MNFEALFTVDSQQSTVKVMLIFIQLLRMV